MTTAKELIQARRKRIADELNDTPGILAKLYSRQDFARIGHNVDLMARSLLLRGMMSYRIEDDVKAAFSDFQASCELTKEFDRAIKGIQGGEPGLQTAYLDIADLGIPLYTCLLASNWDRVVVIAKLSQHPAVQEKGDPIRAIMSKLLVALILDDKNEFTVLRSKYDRLKKSHWWQYFIIYIDLYESVLNRDQERFDALMETAEKKFQARASDRKFGDLRPEYGGGQENNAVVLDFMSLGIAKVALKRGMRVARDSDVMPRSLLERG